MKKFNFELSEILEVRKFQQQQAELDLGKAVQKENEIQKKLDNLALQKANTQKMMKGSVDFNAISNAERFYGFLKVQTEYLLNELTQAKIVTEQKRKVLASCMQKTDSLEQLKAEQEAQYKEDMKKAEMKQINDIVTSRLKLKS